MKTLLAILFAMTPFLVAAAPPDKAREELNIQEAAIRYGWPKKVPREAEDLLSLLRNKNLFLFSCFLLSCFFLWSCFLFRSSFFSGFFLCCHLFEFNV